MKHKKRLILALLLALAVIVVSFAATGVVIMAHADGMEGEFDYLLVLGTAVEGTEPSDMLRDRIEAASAYLTEHPDVICIVSGYQSGSGEISEAACMYRELVERGIEPHRIWMEPNAGSTLENLAFSLALIEEKTGTRPDSIGLLSSEYHIYRACMVAEECGITATGIPAPTRWFTLKLNYFLREVAALWYYLVF